MSDRKTRPPLCPCPKSCQPLYNALAYDERVKDGDLDEGYSGDCIGQAKPTEYVVGGQVHRNDMNHCVFTPLKGAIRFQVCEGDVEGMLHMSQRVLADLHPERRCDECGAMGPWVHWCIERDGRRLCCSCHYRVGADGATTELSPRKEGT